MLSCPQHMSLEDGRDDASPVSISSMVKAGVSEERLQSHRKVMGAFPYIGQTQGGSAAKMPYGRPGVLPHGRGVFEQSWDDD